MAYNETLANRIAEQLLDAGANFREKKMFGGLCFMIDEKMCLGVVKQELMLRVLDERYNDVLEMNYAKPMKFTGKEMKGFVFVEEGGYESTKDLKKWIDMGIEFSRFGIVKTKKKSLK